MSSQVKVNSQAFKLGMAKFVKGIGVEPSLKIVGALLVNQTEQTFRDQGAPAGSWPPLAASTLKRRKFRAGDKMLIRSGRLKNSNAQQITSEGNKGQLLFGNNLVYGRIQQEGGYAGRKAPSRRSGARRRAFRRPYIPARPYLVFPPEQKIQAALERAYNAAAQSAGFKAGKS